MAFYEFFAGAGMARAGLGANWTCTFANDIDPKKAAAYAANFGRRGLVVGDVGALKPADLPSRADLTRASAPLPGRFPGRRLAVASRVPVAAPSGRLFGELAKALRAEGRAPRLIVLENAFRRWTGRSPYPRVGFIVTNMARPAENVVAFYNKRGTCEQWIKEGKARWTRLSCRSFAASAVRLQLHALAYNLGNFLRTLATTEPIKDWSLTSLKELARRPCATAAMSPSRWPRLPFRDYVRRHPSVHRGTVATTFNSCQNLAIDALYQR